MANLKATDEEVATLRDLIEVQELQQWRAAELMGWTLRQVEYLVKKHAMRTQRTGPRSGPGHPNWNGGRTLDSDGYVTLWMPDHPNARENGRVLEHRFVMSEILGRPLADHEVVHHRNGVKDDNRPENLAIFESNADHLRHELTGRPRDPDPPSKAERRREVAAKRRQRRARDARE